MSMIARLGRRQAGQVFGDIASQKHGSQNQEAQIDLFASIDAAGPRQWVRLATHETRTYSNPLPCTHRVAV